MILSLVLSKIKFLSRIISAAPPTRQGYLRTAAAGVSSLTREGLAPAHAC